MNALAVSLGAALGALTRWQASVMFNARWAGFPLGTLLVNLVGGFLIGIALEWFGRQPNELLKLLLVTGFLGGLTTFSAFSGESLALLQKGAFGMAAAHTLAHVLGALVAAWAGMRLVQALI
ncbi:fluoride efflux transporter CrcB [Pelomonas cellulosilytica]|uniref:Fluoride-specific ion channel FluC n=1 Tax=Pelomonas cellulosilytica TaxID=2906762 RepID=A0ABS8XS09_9BURK|nr:fluoride efflux transporter CrcB [Pelomonas sp. P8]MCE4553469.1 fluoride efflux transporter CrcB [Pelomonas sp. P8]